MIRRAHVVRLVSGASESFRTLRATFEHRREEEAFLDAWERWQDAEVRGGAGVATIIHVGDDALGPETTELSVRLWIEGDRFREECGGTWGEYTTISDGRTMWRQVPQVGLVRADGVPWTEASFAARLVDPAPLLAGLDVDVLERVEHAGRPAFRVRAAPREITWHDLFGLSPGADEYELLVDAERGLLLSATALWQGDRFASSAAVEVEFDQQLADGLFVLTPPPGAPVLTTDDLASDTVQVTLAEAARRTSFTVWAPRVEERGRILDVGYSGRAGRSFGVECVHMSYGGGAAGLSISQTARNDERASGWELVERGGQEFRVWWEPDRRWTPIAVVFHRDDTTIELQSDDVDLERLLAIAASFERVSPEPSHGAG